MLADFILFKFITLEPFIAGLVIFLSSNIFCYLLTVGEREFLRSSSSSAFVPNISYFRFNFGLSGLTVFGADKK
jgi:hypothetical protein